MNRILICFLFFIGKKAYGEWEIGEVLEKFLHKSGSSVGDINKLDIGNTLTIFSYFGLFV